MTFDREFVDVTMIRIDPFLQISNTLPHKIDMFDKSLVTRITPDEQFSAIAPTGLDFAGVPAKEETQCFPLCTSQPMSRDYYSATVTLMQLSLDGADGYTTTGWCMPMSSRRGIYANRTSLTGSA